MNKKLARVVRNALTITAAAPIVLTIFLILLAAFTLIWVEAKINGDEFEPPLKEL